MWISEIEIKNDRYDSDMLDSSLQKRASFEFSPNPVCQIVRISMKAVVVSLFGQSFDLIYDLSQLPGKDFSSKYSRFHDK